MTLVRLRRGLPGILPLVWPLVLAAGCSFDTAGLVVTGDGDAEESGDGGAGPKDGPQDRVGGADRPSDARPSDTGAVDAPAGETGAKQGNGTACTGAGACASNFCVDGVCCEFLCAGMCQSCVMSQTGQPNGLCRPVPVGMDPDNECPDDGATSCKRDGSCDGLGACQLYAANTACGSPVCTGSTRTPTRRCNGAGTCQAPPPDQVCPNALVCENNVACRTKCVTVADCAPGFICVEGMCKARQGNGKACDVALDGADCNSGHCADGVCCDLACTGTCRACTLARTGQPDGKCANVTTGSDPDNDCKAEDPSTCGRDGACDGQGGCRKFSEGTTCGSVCCQGSRRCGQVCRGGQCVDTDNRVEDCSACCCPTSGMDGKAVCGPKSLCPQTCQ